MKFTVNAGESALFFDRDFSPSCAGSERNISFAFNKKAKIHVAGTPNITSFVYHVGKEKGFYREEGIELQPIMAGMLQGIQGLIGGSFDYSQMLGQGGGAILRGAPLKIIMAFDTPPVVVSARRQEYEKLAGVEGKTARGLKLSAPPSTR